MPRGNNCTMVLVIKCGATEVDQPNFGTLQSPHISFLKQITALYAIRLFMYYEIINMNPTRKHLIAYGDGEIYELTLL